MAGEHTFNFAQLDAVAADLDLGIDAAEEIEVAIGQQPHHVAAAEEARAGAAAECVGHELGRGQLRPVEVSARYARATNTPARKGPPHPTPTQQINRPPATPGGTGSILPSSTYNSVLATGRPM